MAKPSNYFIYKISNIIRKIGPVFTPKKTKQKLNKAITYLLSYLIIMQPVMLSAADIAPVNTAGSNTNLGTASAGIPVLNINAPTSAGVSNNKFNEFNVGENGLIINNLNMVNYNPNYISNLSGEHVEFNYNFGTGLAANVILNQVVSSSDSKLNGYTEIYGQKADYIVANPNGITCNGCGFINTGQLSLITGTANITNGDIETFTIAPNATLNINNNTTVGFGLHAPSSADLVSNAIHIAGQIYSDSDINIYSGNDKFDYKNKIVSSNNILGNGIAVDSNSIGGIKANNIKIYATQKGFGINTAGNLVADLNNVEITADGNIEFKKVLAEKDFIAKSNNGNITASGENIHAQNININSSNNFVNNAIIESSGNISIKNGNNFTNYNQIVSGLNLNIENGNNLTNNLNSYIISNNELNMIISGDINNIGKIQSSGNANFTAKNINNYGQFLSNSNLDFTVLNDLINYRASGILSGGDINFHIGRDLVNYKSDIYASGDINFEGIDGQTPISSGLDITLTNSSAKATQYNNPYISAETNIVIDPPVIATLPDDAIEYVDTEYKLGDGTTTILPVDAFSDTPIAGDTYTNSDGYIFIIGTENKTETINPIYTACFDAGNDCTGISETITTYSYTGTDTVTIKNSSGVNQTYTISEPETETTTSVTQDISQQLNAEIPIQNGTNTYSTNSLNDSKISVFEGITFNDNLMGTLLNWAGRIEAGNNLEINASKIKNYGFDINTGASAATIQHVYLNEPSRWRSYGWTVVDYYAIKSVNMDSVPAQMISGNTLTLNGNEIINQDSIISSDGNINLNATGAIKNQTNSQVLTLYKHEKQRYWSCRHLKCGFKTENRYLTEQKRVYSKQRSLILSGADLKIKSNTLTNDQNLNPDSGIALNTPVPEDVKNIVSVNTELPVGDNGLFHVVPNSKYLVQSNVSFINANEYIGSDYFFKNLGGGTTQINTNKIIGDAAYETRLITDAILKATGNRYIDGFSDTEQMTALYNNAIDASVKLNLHIGIALTQTQIRQLQDDIIWYVEQDIGGAKVLVPQLYLSQATLYSIDNSKGSKITGVNLISENNYVVNVGTLSANNILSINTSDLINKSTDQLASISAGGALSITTTDKIQNLSGSISGNTVDITATDLINKTNVLSSDTEQGNTKKHTEQTAQTATISGTNGTDINLSGTLHNTAGNIESKSGDINISADSVIFDTAVLTNTSETTTNNKGFLSSKKTTNITKTIDNVGSELNAGGDINIKTNADATFAGATVNTGNNANLEIGGNTNIIAVIDKDYSYSETNKSSWGGLKKTVDINEISDENLAATNVNVTNGLTLNTGNNLNILGSNINVGGNANIDANGNINVLSGTETKSVYSYHKETNYLTDIAKVTAELALAGVTGGTSLLVANDGLDVNCSGGSCGVNVEIGHSEKDENTTKTKTSIGSAINVGGNLEMSADKNINVQGSDINVTGNGNLTAGENINIIESKNETSQSGSHSDTTITAGTKVGNAYVDTAYAAKALYDAGDAVTKAAEALKEIQELHDAGRASSSAVVDAELNLTMATLNLANAELAMVSSIASAAGAAGTSFGTGIYVAGSLNFETNKNSFDITNTQSVGSNIYGNNLTLNTGANMTQSGSDVIALDTINYNIGNDLNIVSSTDNYNSSSGSETTYAGGSIGNNLVQINAGYNTSKNTATSTTNNNSTVQAENINITTGNDTKIAGANVKATDTITANIGGDLNVESRQDTDYANGSNFGLNIGGGNGSVNSGFNTGNSNHDSAWVNNQTEITGSNVNINVDGKTTLTGAVIAAVDTNGNDNGNLNLTTGELAYSDITDFNNNNATGFGLGTGVGGNTDAGISNLHPSGSTTISMQNTGSESEQINRATIGGGNLTITNNTDTSGLNRDISVSKEITKDITTGALDTSVTIDNRLFSGTGRAQIENQHENILDNVEQIGDGLRNNIIVKSIENYVTDDTKSLSDTISDYIEQDKKMTRLQQEKQELVTKLNGITNYNSEEAKETFQEFANFVSENGGFSGELSLANINGNVVGFSYQSNDGTVKNISINLANLDLTDPNAIVNALYHETTNFAEHKANEQTAKNRGDTGSAIFDLKNYGNANTNIMDNGQWLSNYDETNTITNGNLSLVSDINNISNGNGSGAPFGEIAIPLAGAGCVGTTIGCPIGATAGFITGAAIEAGLYIGVTAGGLYLSNELTKDIDKGELSSEIGLLTGSSSPAGFADLSDEEKEAAANSKKTEVKNENNNLSSKTMDKISKVRAEAERTNYNNNLKNYKGGSEYENKNLKLPKGEYREFDLDSKIKGIRRNMERIVIEKNTGKTYYTNNHYETFIEVP